MIRPVRMFCLLLVSIGCLCSAFGAETYPLLQGAPMVGDPMIPTADTRGIIFKKPDGSVSERVAWTNFTQAALKQLEASPRLKRYVEPLLEPEIEEIVSKEKEIQEIKPKVVPGMERPDPKAGFGDLFSSPLFLVVALLLYAANVYAAYEISIFRNYPAALVCGVAAVLPVIGPAIFICLPTKMKHAAQPVQEVPVEEYAHAHAEAEAAPVEEVAAPVPEVPTAPALPQPIVYQRGQFVFNRRFFETKLNGFLRPVPGEAEKDMVIFVRSARGEYVAPRLTKVTPTELVLQIRKGEATTDVPIPFPEIIEVQIRHKDLA